MIEFELLQKQRERNYALGIYRPHVLSGQSFDHRTGRPTPDHMDEEEEPSEISSDEEGENVNSDDSDDSDEPASSRKDKTKDGDVDMDAGSAPAAKKTSRERERIMVPEEVRAHLRRLFDEEARLCSLIWGRHGPLSLTTTTSLSTSADMFFMEVLPVPPTRFRPPARMNDSIMEHPQNTLLTKVLQTSYRLKELSRELKEASAKNINVAVDGSGSGRDRERVLASLMNQLIQLQTEVNSFMESKKNPTILRQGQLPIPGVKDGLEKKEGLFRMNMMVNLLSSLISER